MKKLVSVIVMFGALAAVGAPAQAHGPRLHLRSHPAALAAVAAAAAIAADAYVYGPGYGYYYGAAPAYYGAPGYPAVRY